MKAGIMLHKNIILMNYIFDNIKEFFTFKQTKNKENINKQTNKQKKKKKQKQKQKQNKNKDVAYSRYFFIDGVVNLICYWSPLLCLWYFECPKALWMVTSEPALNQNLLIPVFMKLYQWRIRTAFYFIHWPLNLVSFADLRGLVVKSADS